MSFQHFPPLMREKPEVHFTSEDVDFKLEKEEETGKWLKKVIEQEGQQLHLLNFIFCSDKYLHQLNIEYLDHDTLTDVITFPYAELPTVEGDIFISIERVKENSKKFNVSFLKELQRVMIHGVFHLCGYGDKTEVEAKLIRQKENEALVIL